jgi:hypothetical protein
MGIGYRLSDSKKKRGLEKTGTGKAIYAYACPCFFSSRGKTENRL